MEKEKDQLYKIRHSLAHVLAKAVLEIDSGAKLAIGPPVDDGFYYDFELSEGIKIGDAELKNIQKRMRKIVQKGFEPERKELSIDDAREMFTEQPYKLELIDGIAKDGSQITSYELSGFIDLCEGPHVESAEQIDPRAFKLAKVAGAYWRGDESNIMLTRIYAYAFKTPLELEAHLEMLEEAKKRDHRKIGKEQNLFVFSDLVGSGMPLYTPKGNFILGKITDYSRELNTRLGYGEVHTPNINKAELFKISGHYDQYKDDMLTVHSQYVKDEMFLKPMNCPQHTQIYASAPRSYRDLPIRFSDFANLYRDERPGELSGLTRLRAFRQDDGHSFCREDQIEEEVSQILTAIQEALKTYGLEYVMRLSLRDSENKDKYLGSDEVWDKAESILRKLLTDKGINFTQEEGEAAFYGPKIDIVAVDALGREWQISTAQLDFSMPSRFGLEYTDKDGNKQTPVMIHRALVGSPERFMAILIEHYGGAFPAWLSPEQVRIVPVADAHSEYAHRVLAGLEEVGIRASVHEATDSLGKRIRSAKKEKIPYTLVLGDKEQKAGSVTAELRDDTKLELSLNDFVERVVGEIENKA